MLSCSIWFSAPSFLMAGGLESRYVDRVHHPHRTNDPRSGSQYQHSSKKKLGAENHMLELNI